MSVRLPSPGSSTRGNRRLFGMRLGADEVRSRFRGLMASSIASYNRLDELPRAEASREISTHTRVPAGSRRESVQCMVLEDRDCRRFEWDSCREKGCSEGQHVRRGRSDDERGCAGSKANVPDVDATVVTRVLDNGGEVAGKAACEDLCFSAASHTCATGPIRNPHNPEYSTGGSSGGSAALVAAGEVEMALGGDQGGSIRTPSAWCGVYGLKPTWGLVPMTGGMPISYSVDHCGPICNSVENVARLLTAIAGQR